MSIFFRYPRPISKDQWQYDFLFNYYGFENSRIYCSVKRIGGELNYELSNPEGMRVIIEKIDHSMEFLLNVLGP